MDCWPKWWAAPPSFESVNWASFVKSVSEDRNELALSDFLEADILLIDDMGTEEDRFKSGAGNRILGDVLGHINDSPRPRFSFITTNIPPGEWGTRWDSRVEDRLWRLQPEIVNLWERGQSYAAWRMRSR